MTSLGRHLIIEVYDADRSVINDPALLEKIFLEAARLSNATVLSSHFHSYEPQGVSGVIIISESHFTIHTWPEFGYAAVDVFYCDEKVKVQNAVEYFSEKLRTEKIVITADLRRGILAE